MAYILAVDDEPDVCALLERTLARDGHTVRSCTSGAQVEMPDAFVCVSDFVAFVTLSLLADRGYRVPEDVRLTGYDDSQDFMLDNHKISTVHVQNGLLGKRMVHQLLYRIDNPTADFEEIFIYPKVLNKN